MSTWKNRIESELELCSGSDKNNNWYKIIEKITDIIDIYPDESVKVALDLVLESWNHKPWSSISLSDENLATIGGHLKDNCLVNVTAEIVLGEFEDYEFGREFDENTGYKELTIKEI